MQPIAPGIWKVRFGRPEKHTPVSLREEKPQLKAMAWLPQVKAFHLKKSDVRFALSARGCTLEIPLDAREQIFGLGLQMKRFNQTLRKKTLRVNSDPVADTGDSHAPVPFCVSTRGYGIFVDTARYATFYAGTHVKAGASRKQARKAAPSEVDAVHPGLVLSRGSLQIDIPATRGVDVYFIAGPEMLHAIQRYNLFSGGGCLPPMWGLGIWYRTYAKFNAVEALSLMEELRKSGMPCDVLGLEPGWQTQAYSCSYVWSPERFPDPKGFVKESTRMGYKLNLWEHVFVHPTSPIYDKLLKHSGSEEVWNGLVPDLSIPAARKVFGDYHDKQFVSKGILGFKLDECDNSDFVSAAWSFPESSRFPSGMDGEQMHSMLGILYQRCLHKLHRRANQRTYSEVRSSHALAAPYPYVLYSDLYDHRDFVRALLNSGFSGLLWSPEVRQCLSVEELIRRVQAVALSPQALVNSWMIKHPPWVQVEQEKNNNDEPMADQKEVTALCRRIFRLRMSLVPYIYAAFARYRFDGTPPFRALVADYPNDPNTYKLDDQWLIGDSLLAAPVFAGSTERAVYLPAGDWYDFFTQRRYRGGESHILPATLETLPLFVRGGSILPLAEPVDHIERGTRFDISVTAYGAPCRPTRLYEDDGESFDFEKGAANWVELAWNAQRGPRVTREGKFKRERYKIGAWKHVE